MKLEISQEPDRIATRRLVVVAALSIVTGAAGVVVSRFLDLPERHRAPEPARATIGMIEQSSIESTERGIALRKEQEAALHVYRWRNRDAGLAEIPIERAMQIEEERAR